MLAILARPGQFLPRCLTFGPRNGPGDFCYVIDRICSPGKQQVACLQRVARVCGRFGCERGSRVGRCLVYRC
eukprot:8967776-Alexandrium_andersonii.AAC.1